MPFHKGSSSNRQAGGRATTDPLLIMLRRLHRQLRLIPFRTQSHKICNTAILKRKEDIHDFQGRNPERSRRQTFNTNEQIIGGGDNG